MTDDLFTDFEKKCEKVKIPKKEIERAITYLKPNIKKNEIIDWYFSIGPFPPVFPETKLDCFILTKKNLIDCEFKNNNPLIHIILLEEVINISEKIANNIIYVSISIASLAGIVIPERLKYRENLEKFVNEIRKITMN